MKTTGIRFSLLVIFILSSLFAGCQNKSSETSSSNTYKPQPENSMDIKKLLEKQKFENSKSADTKYLYVIVPDQDEIKVEKYEIKNSETQNITVYKNKDFILSFPGNRNKNYLWNISNEVDESFIKLKEEYWSKPSFLSFKNKNRYNLHFQTLRSGRQALRLRYEYSEKKISEQFEATIIVTSQ